MTDRLCSVGLDVGTTTTQLIVSQLTIENRAGAFAVPELAITDRKILYESPVFFTPLLNGELVDAQALRTLVMEEYEKAGISRSDVDTGAIIITGETSRKENAQQVLHALSDLAGDFVVATAGPHLESVLAAKGAGSLEISQHRDTPVLHMDIGGGTSNLALLKDGRILRTGCLNVGGRLLKFTPDGIVTYVSPVLDGLTALKPGEHAAAPQTEAVAQLLVQALEMAAGLRPPDTLLDRLSTQEAGAPFSPAPAGTTVILSGGVAECVSQSHPPFAFGDLGPVLGSCIRKSRLAGHYELGRQTIRATVIGAGCHAAQLSGSTVYAQGVSLPVKNLPVITFSQEEQQSSSLSEQITRRIQEQDSPPVLYFPGFQGASYDQVSRLADAIAQASTGDMRICLQQDMAKALGQALKLRHPHQGVLCLDGLTLSEGDYLDVGTPVGPTFPVVIKTLALMKDMRYQ